MAIKIQNFLCNHSDQKNDFLFLKKTKQKVVNFVKAFMSYIGWVRFLLCMLFGIRHITTWNLQMKLQIIYVISYFNNQIYFLDMPFLIIHDAKKFRINVAAAGITYAYALVAYNRSWYIEVSILPIFPEIFDTSFNPFAFLLHLYFDTPR